MNLFRLLKPAVVFDQDRQVLAADAGLVPILEHVRKSLDQAVEQIDHLAVISFRCLELALVFKQGGAGVPHDRALHDVTGVFGVGGGQFLDQGVGFSQDRCRIYRFLAPVQLAEDLRQFVAGLDLFTPIDRDRRQGGCEFLLERERFAETAFSFVRAPRECITRSSGPIGDRRGSSRARPPDHHELGVRSRGRIRARLPARRAGWVRPGECP